MPCRRFVVVVRLASGKELVCEATRRHSVRSLKIWLKCELRYSKWRFVLAEAGRICDDAVLLGSLVRCQPLPDYCVVADIVPAMSLMPLEPLHLELFVKGAMVTCSCCGCGGLDFKRCSGCLEVWYCSVECQGLHWIDHKQDCRKHQGALSIAKKGFCLAG